MLPGSPAINGGNLCVFEAPLCANAPLSSDQRGLTRKTGVSVDIGAYEEQFVPTAAGLAEISRR